MQTRKIGLFGATIAVLLMIGTAAFAQTPKTQKGQKRQGGGRAASLAALPVDTLDSLLKLTPDQKTKLTTIHDRYEADTKTLRPAKGAPVDPAGRQKLAAATKQANAEVEAVLTAEQKSKLQTVRQDMVAFQAAGIPVALAGELKLTPDQKEKLASIISETRGKMREADPTQRKVLRQEIHAKMEAVLTAEQKAAVQKYMQAHKGERKKKKP